MIETKPRINRGNRNKTGHLMMFTQRSILNRDSTDVEGRELNSI